MRPRRWQHYGVSDEGLLLAWHPVNVALDGSVVVVRTLGTVVSLRPYAGAMRVYFRRGGHGRILLVPFERFHEAVGPAARPQLPHRLCTGGDGGQ